MSKLWLKPNWEPGKCVHDLSIRQLSDAGIKGLILDVDKTLLYGKEVLLDRSVISWVNQAKTEFKLHLLSNNPSKTRIGSVAKQLAIPFTFGAAKPRGTAIRNVINNMNIYPGEIAMIGDRLFTDILAGNRLGLYTILVKPIGSDGNPCKNDKVQILEKKFAALLGAYKQ